jgi:hypothetical protein
VSQGNAVLNAALASAVPAVPSQTSVKHFAMTRPRQPPPVAAPRLPRDADAVSDAAFELWLQRSLHQLFDKVAKEPIPEHLLRLIEDHRPK